MHAIAALLREQGLDGAVWTTLDAQGAAGASDARRGKPMRAVLQLTLVLAAWSLLPLRLRA